MMTSLAMPMAKQFHLLLMRRSTTNKCFSVKNLLSLDDGSWLSLGMSPACSFIKEWKVEELWVSDIFLI